MELEGAAKLQLSAILAALPNYCIVSIAGLGKYQLAVNGMHLLFAAGVYIGLEDNIWFDQGRSRHASNFDLVKRDVSQAVGFERDLMSALRCVRCLDFDLCCAHKRELVWTVN